MATGAPGCCSSPVWLGSDRPVLPRRRAEPAASSLALLSGPGCLVRARLGRVLRVLAAASARSPLSARRRGVKAAPQPGAHANHGAAARQPSGAEPGNAHAPRRDPQVSVSNPQPPGSQQQGWHMGPVTRVSVWLCGAPAAGRALGLASPGAGPLHTRPGALRRAGQELEGTRVPGAEPCSVLAGVRRAGGAVLQPPPLAQAGSGGGDGAPGTQPHPWRRAGPWPPAGRASSGCQELFPHPRASVQPSLASLARTPPSRPRRAGQEPEPACPSRGRSRSRGQSRPHVAAPCCLAGASPHRGESSRCPQLGRGAWAQDPQVPAGTGGAAPPKSPGLRRAAGGGGGRGAGVDPRLGRPRPRTPHSRAGGGAGSGHRGRRLQAPSSLALGTEHSLGPALGCCSPPRRQDHLSPAE